MERVKSRSALVATALRGVCPRENKSDVNRPQASDYNVIRSSLQNPPLGHGRLHHHQFGHILRSE